MGSGGFTVAAREGHSRAYKGVKDYTHAPDVGLEVAGLVLDHLWGHEADCSSHLLDALVLVKFAGETEVANFDLGGFALIT